MDKYQPSEPDRRAEKTACAKKALIQKHINKTETECP